MAFALTQNKGAQTTAANGTVTLDSAPTQGSLIVVAARFDLATSGVTGPSGYTQRAFVGASVRSVGIWSKIAAAAESATITFTHVSALYAIEAYVFTGNAATSEFDQAVSDAGTGGTVTSMQPGSITPPGAGRLFVTAALQSSGNGGTEAIDSTFTIIDATVFDRFTTGWKESGTAANPTHSWATARISRAAMATFNPAVTSVSGVAVSDFGSLTGTAVGVRTVTATTVSSWGGLTATASGVPSVGGVAVSPLGGLSATAVGAGMIAGVVVAPLGGLSATASGTVLTPVTGLGIAPLGELLAAATGIVSASTGVVDEPTKVAVWTKPANFVIVGSVFHVVVEA